MVFDKIRTRKNNINSNHINANHTHTIIKQKSTFSIINNIIVISLTIGLLLVFYNQIKFTFDNFSLINIRTYGLLLLLMGGALFTLKYLQSSDKSDPLGIRVDIDKKEIESLKETVQLLEDNVFTLSNKQKESENELTKDDRKILRDEIIDKATNESIERIFAEQSNLLEEDFKKVLGIQSIKESFKSIIYRLSGEIKNLKLRANVNLVIGGAITIGGLYFLWTTVGMMDNSEFLMHEVNGKFVKKEIDDILLAYGPRVLLVIFIETFAFFFLRLYKLGLDEIKYFQNELTNIESKLISVEVAYITKDEKSMKEALKVLVQTERNFVLKKGETTVELERAKSESENMQNIIKAVPDLFKSKGK